LSVAGESVWKIDLEHQARGQQDIATDARLWLGAFPPVSQHLPLGLPERARDQPRVHNILSIERR
jgi:hypothetical protein